MSSSRRWGTLALVSLAVLVLGIDNSILIVALPTLSTDVGATTSQLQWIVDAYTLVYACLMLTAGSFGDRYGRAKVLRLGLIVFSAASAIAAFSGDAATLTICRGLMGVGGAMVTPAALSVLTNVFIEPAERARAIAVWAATAGVGVAAGPVVGGILLEHFWWGSIFLVNVPIGLALFVASFRYLPESRDPHPRRVDPVGVLLSIVGLALVLWATIEAPDQGWTSPAILGAYAASAVAIVAFVVWESTNPHAMLDVGLFNNARFSVGTIALCATIFVTTGTLFVATQFLQLVQGHDPLEAGLQLAPLALSSLLFGLVSPRLATRFGTHRTVAAGLMLLAVGSALLAVLGPDSSALVTVVPLAIIGSGNGLSFAPALEAVMGSAPKERAGMVSATNNTCRQTAMALGIAIIGSLVASAYASAAKSDLAGFDLTPAMTDQAVESLGGALDVAQELGGTAGEQLASVARAAFVDAMTGGVVLCVLVAAASVVLVLRWLPARGYEESPMTSAGVSAASTAAGLPAPPHPD